jgi:integrase/recombinase XerC/integrase/recombinase XerD
MVIENALSEFLIEQQIRGNTPKTLRYYTVSIGQYSSFAGLGLPLSEITLQSLRRYYMHLSGRGLSTTTIQTYIRALRAFLTWCYGQEYITENLSERFRLPKAQQKVIDVLTDSEVCRLLACFNLRYIIHLRNYCICSLMLDSGLRMHEVTTLTMNNLHIPEGYTIVNGKGNKQRLVPLGLQTRKYLSRYLSRRPACVLTDRVFLMANGETVTDNTIHLMFRRLKTRAAIPRLRAHLLRHTFATRYLENGGDMYALQQILGHTSLEMVKRYVHTTTRKTVPTFPLYSPLDNLMKA